MCACAFVRPASDGLSCIHSEMEVQAGYSLVDLSVFPFSLVCSVNATANESMLVRIPVFPFLHPSCRQSFIDSSDASLAQGYR